MGELILGRPALKLEFAVSVPLDLTSALSLVFRATDPRRFDRWLVEARERLDPEARHDLDTVLGSSGRLLYYVEELLMSFDPFTPEHLDADFDAYIAHLRSLPPWAYHSMMAQSLLRVYRDRGVTVAPPDTADRTAWRAFLEPGITRADLDEVVDLVLAPEQLKARTISLIERFWHDCYHDEYHRTLPEMRRALRQARSTTYPSVAVAFEELSGHRLPEEVQLALPHVERVTICPSYHLGNFAQFILYPPELILYFNCQRTSAATQPARGSKLSADLLPGLRALADGTRLRIIEMLQGGELYAQEIVGRLGISQSAVSRHLSMLEAADIVKVRPTNGMKYYAINAQRLRQIAEELEQIG
ncbi:ArsR/SmtB family transcription factor [Sphaerobacter thermophilus]|jgi:Predicted transcriptional regulators|uniref:Transcriptional regulator, ArsR family n=1 Tax=Sphaerobacter thermophilus (strain ATCC 49802 / DSM 20745 / KCCM 41009 / NCIMB 13125 / S 6022) TaxID=479434 RepID=D1C797_SPHTD|nr:metalloregulator ArsR/SmtB family transcription factor [Sphaerobacter thermophilus]ACZ39743.1 transcriptional regulator, ArsR family [Sphaerobacter thermophilus DSM 20745]PZN67104.1 MAG: ArsR family transcriptional regulator [Sphaerobacter thermophilus]